MSRNYLMYEGLIDGSVRGLWKLTEKGQSADITDNYAAQILYRWNKKQNLKMVFKNRKTMNLMTGNTRGFLPIIILDSQWMTG